MRQDKQLLSAAGTTALPLMLVLQRPATFYHTWLQASAGTCNMLVAASQGQLLVYSGDRLAWAATAEGCPVALAIATLAGTAGLIVSLTSSGKVQREVPAH